MKRENKIIGTGLGFLEALQLLLIAFKFGGVGTIATWSWWKVLLPFEIGIILAILLVVFGVFVSK
ncbi:MAG: transmembrane Fragile-X-F family protein [bacterium]|nr:transmembrane Fragile-X-F family protein [bacterium]